MNLLTRRNFLKNSFLSSVVFVGLSGELRAFVTPLETISVLQGDLFPDEGSAPAIELINAPFYLNTIILNHAKINRETKSFIRDGVKWLNEESMQKYKKVYAKLTPQKRERVLKSIVESDWGESWLETIMTYLLEAALGDPVYGINGGERGWEWLEHQPGYPRPKKAYL